PALDYMELKQAQMSPVVVCKTTLRNLYELMQSFNIICVLQVIHIHFFLELEWKL
ncbi:hypothetical protein ACJX0J_041257, partial [Zea mays]